jgi:2-oxoglutarate ferredoxin oxidoreductase subunit beta
VARGFSGDPRQLSELIQAAINHKGFSLIEVLQPCVTFNKLNTFRWYRERAFKVEDEGHDPGNLEAAWRVSRMWGERIPTGIIYRAERPCFEQKHPVLAGKTTLAALPMDPTRCARELEGFR